LQPYLFQFVHYKLRRYKFFALLISILFAIFSIANLQAGSSQQRIERKGIDVMVALDVSKSMWARDVSPNRLEKAKQFIHRFIEQSPDNRIGLIVFAGNAYLSVPLTIDHSALKMNLSTASPTMVPTQGTAIGSAIKLSIESLNSKQANHKAIILITDGEDHDEDAVAQSKIAKEKGIMINTIGIGSPLGSPIWDEELQQYKKDKEGNEIRSALNEKILMDIASVTAGRYIHLNNVNQAIPALNSQLQSIKHMSFSDSLYTDYKSYYQYFLGISLLFFLGYIFFPEKKKTKYSV
jgi:Mg-chelatase subunit ChlD